MDQSAPDALVESDSPASCDTTLYVCVTCRAGEEGDDAAPRAGRQLHDALSEAHRRLELRPGFRIVEVECLSNCKRGCSAALTAPGRWSYIYGDLGLASVDDLIAGAARYAATEDGLIPWKERPAIFRKGVIARIPPSPKPV
jgi:predicted metal-binding protein